MQKSIYLYKYIIALIIAIAVVIAIIFGVRKFKGNSYAIEEKTVGGTLEISVPIAKQNSSKTIDLESIISQNEQEIITERIERQETDIEFTTLYRQNDSLAKGKIQTLQEGQDGKQNAIIKKIYKNGEQISEEQISSEIKQVSIDKIVEIGTAAFSSNYVPIVGDSLKVTSNTLAIRIEPKEESQKLITIHIGDLVTLKAKEGDWYYVEYNTYLGWAPMDCLTYVNPNGTGDGDENNHQYTKEELSQDLGFSMLLNKKSGLTLEQFKKVLENDPSDKNNIFKDNAEYFYYVEQQYNINGLFVAAVGIHESAWGTSSISQTKKNLFGYGAYDRDPSGNAMPFENYSEGIDLVARVFVKYYLNPAGTDIYNGEKAVGTYYKGATLTAVNKSYATDKNWANGVYRWMMYLYNKL